MGLLDGIILAAVAIAVILCVRHLLRARSDGGCAGCGQAGSCASARTGVGECPCGQRMVDDLSAGMEHFDGGVEEGPR
ncbi:MAG: FeoB-associated Cys-rich membrane protein [Atopobiaceae bacterium]|jgi:hypothetical protein|nr:FeoB-associated Cys-rich membrane protein [Atopobiaceae bacterium]MCH4179828.1 FeoB-associated Cys-rich membrane protein [Atopobiaceae bacterium]MCH4213579.1 FeoB-associated Cys-rich membrane protein [Atopobiaceae bacterium]MCH4230034.1 FeoB-associated Cys-rich membrane protein [Atopobiaceae bacterium]MCH4276227.1 FeoB-associated Cys-rich membrane protein [Atopobiaceae bacterium]